MAVNRNVVLWLDEYFDEPGELARSSDFGGLQNARTALVSLGRRLPSLDIVATQTVRRFMTSIIDYIRCRDSLAFADRWTGGEIKAFLVDIMINNVDEFIVPRFSEDRKIEFRENGTIDGWNPIKTEDFNAGIAVTRYFIRQISDLDNVPVIFYTNRAINSALEKEIESISKLCGGLNVVLPKSGGISEVEKMLKGLK
jgi:hypothetical protein